MKMRWIAVVFVVILELAVCGGIAAVAWNSFSAIDFRHTNVSVFSTDGVSAVATEESKYPVTGSASVSVNKNTRTGQGNVKVTASKGTEIVVKTTKTAWASDAAAAQAKLAQVQVDIKQSGNDIVIQTVEPDQVVVLGSVRPSSVDFEIEVPLATSTYLVTGAGNVDIAGTTAPVHLETDAGVITGANLGGGTIEAQAGFGDIRLDDIKAVSVDASSNSGGISLKNAVLSGNAKLQTDFGNVSVVDGSANSLSMDTNSGRLEIDNFSVAAAASLSSDFGEVAATSLTANSVELRSKSGTIRATAIVGDLTAHTDFGDVVAKQVTQGQVDLSSNSGNLAFSGGLGAGPHEFSTDFGQITLTLPMTTNTDVNLQTDFGSIHSDLPVNITGDRADGHWTGRLGAGGSQLTAVTKSGNIVIAADTK